MFSCEHGDRIRFQLDHPDFKEYTYELCEECLSNSCLCFSCGQIHPPDYFTQAGDSNKYICHDCAGDMKKCEHCDTPVYGRRKKSPLGYLCPSCFESLIGLCTCCEERYERQTSFVDPVWTARYDVAQGDYCSTCVEKIEATKIPIEVGACEHCGSITADKFHNAFVCSNHQRYIHTCSDCGSVQSQRSMARIAAEAEAWVCMTCLPKYTGCARCGHYHQEQNQLDLCAQCLEHVVTCKTCGSEHWSDQRCPVCAVYQPCEKCGSPDGMYLGYSFHNEMTSIPSKFRGCSFICHRCITAAGGRLTHHYNFKPPRLKFYGDGPLFLGLEIEISYKNIEDRQVGINKMGREFSVREVHAMHDGSVQCGVEFVTTPMSFEYIRNKFAQRAKALFYRPVNHKTSGMHIHLSADAFSRTHLLRFINMIHDNDPLVMRVAERLSNGYCYKPEKERVVEMAEGKLKGGHHDQMNMTSGKTLELRIFSGVCSVKEMIKNVEFAHALYQFTKVSGAADCTVEKFERFVNDHESRYSILCEWLKIHK